MDALKQRPVLQDAATGDELPQPPRVSPPEFGTHREDRLGFRGEVEGFLRLMVVNPVHPVPVVEERRRSAGPVRHESVEPSIQSGWEAGVLFIEMDQIGGTPWIKPVPSP